MKRFFAAYRGFWNPDRRRSLYLGLLLFALGIFVQVQGARYADRRVTNYVGDIFLDNLPIVNLDFILVEGALFFVTLSVILLICKPRYLLFSLKAIALVLIARGVFISLTHIGVPIGRISLNDTDIAYRLYRLFDFEGDLFFSGHTAFPFLLALIFWKEKLWRFVFLGIGALFAVSVLLSHVHYSIDVFAAPFITYGLYKVAQELFRRDYLLTGDGVDSS